MPLDHKQFRRIFEAKGGDQILPVLRFGDGNKNRESACVLVNSFEIHQARPVLVGWVVGVGDCPAVPSVPAQNKGRLQESTKQAKWTASSELWAS